MRKEALAVLDAKSAMVVEITGGIVFTHPNATYHIQGPASFRCGILPEWIKTYVEAPVLSGMTPEVILHFTETLLKRHQQLNPGMELFSMYYYISDVIGNADKKIRQWIEEPTPT
jgi:hypothetical protein